MSFKLYRIQAMTDSGILYRVWDIHKLFIEYKTFNFYKIINCICIIQPNIDQCKMENQQASAQIKPLSLVDMASAFVVLGLGLSLAFLVFLLELVYRRIKKHLTNDDIIIKKGASKKLSADSKKVNAIPIAATIPSAKIIKEQSNESKNAKDVSAVKIKKVNAKRADTKQASRNNNIPVEVELHVDKIKRADGTIATRTNIPVGNQRNKEVILSSLDEILEI